MTNYPDELATPQKNKLEQGTSQSNDASISVPQDMLRDIVSILRQKNDKLRIMMNDLDEQTRGNYQERYDQVHASFVNVMNKIKSKNYAIQAKQILDIDKMHKDIKYYDRDAINTKQKMAQAAIDDAREAKEDMASYGGLIPLRDKKKFELALINMEQIVDTLKSNFIRQKQASTKHTSKATIHKRKERQNSQKEHGRC